MNTANNPYTPSYVDLNEANQSHGLVLANRGMRFAAALLDRLFYILFAGIPTISVSIALDIDLEENGYIIILIGISSLLLAFLINMLLFYFYAQSLGKKIMHTKVVRCNGEAAGLFRGFILRELVTFIGVIICFIGLPVNLIDSLMIFRDTRRCLHDDIVDTIVVVTD